MKFLLALSLGLASLAHSLEFKPVADSKLGGGYSEEQGQAGSWNASGHLTLLPLLGLNKNNIVAPLLFIDLADRERVIEEDATFLQRLIVVGKPVWKHKFENGSEGSLYGSAKRVVNQEKLADPWSENIYDYEEYGAGLGWSKKLWIFEEASFDLAYSGRTYDNFHNRTPSGAKNYYTKDMNITKLSLGLSLPPSERGKLSLDYFLDLRNYTDAYIIQGDGSIDQGRLRGDQFHYLNIQATKAEGHWGRSLGLQAIWNLSNQNSFDYVANVPYENFYSYASYALRPEISWLPQGKPSGHRVSLGYQALLRNYGGRSIQNPDGTKTQGTQADVEHNFNLNGFYAYNSWLGFYLDLTYDVVRSNQAYENVLKYSYDLFNSTASVGLRY